MSEALVGLLGLLAGLLISEYFRRQRRIEEYAREVFQRRIEIYEGLYKKLLIADSVAAELENGDPEEPELAAARHAIINLVMEYLDRNGLFLDEDLTVHAALTVLNIHEIAEAGSQDKRSDLLREYWERSKELKVLMRRVTGLEKLGKLFQTITKAEIDSEYVDLWRKAKREAGVRTRHRLLESEGDNQE
jgi:hypothetical protein